VFQQKQHKKKGVTVASTKVITTTWDKKALVAKLKETLKRMDAEIAAWDKEDKNFKALTEAWDKKVEAWSKKNLAKANDVDINRYSHRINVTFTYNGDVIEAVHGKRPERSSRPAYKDTNYNTPVSPYAQVESAIALIEGSTDTEFKINTASAWAAWIR
jgi:hypothetical protein